MILTRDCARKVSSEMSVVFGAFCALLEKNINRWNKSSRCHLILSSVSGNVQHNSCSLTAEVDCEETAYI